MGEKPTATDEAEERKSGSVIAADRDAASGMATGRRQHEAVTDEPGGGNAPSGIAIDEPGVQRSARDAASGMATGRRQHEAVTDEPGGDIAIGDPGVNGIATGDVNGDGSPDERSINLNSSRSNAFREGPTAPPDSGPATPAGGS